MEGRVGATVLALPAPWSDEAGHERRLGPERAGDEAASGITESVVALLSRG